MTGLDEKKVALITGAARGLGRAMSLGLAKAGYVVAACDLPNSSVELTSLVREAESDRAAIYPVYCDVTDSEHCGKAVDELRAKFGAIDILVNNAGIGMEVITPHVLNNPYKFYEIDEAFWRRVIDINLLGTFRMTKLIAPYQVARGWGRVINVTTSLTTMLMAGLSPYGPSKAAIEAASSIWSKELAGTGVTVNVLIPGGPADTRMIPHEGISARETLVRPEAMVPPLLWLVSTDADGVTGRRYQAKLWFSDVPVQEAEKVAGARIAWA